MLNRAPNRYAPYVGENAFATKAGIHASAIVKEPATYEHVAPEAVGNKRKVLVSDQAGPFQRAGGTRAHRPQGGEGRSAHRRGCLIEVKQREAQGYAYKSADASFELLARRALGTVPKYFDVTYFDVKVEQRNAQRASLEPLTTAVVKVKVDGETLISAGEGNGPVNALDVALRKDLGKYQRYISGSNLPTIACVSSMAAPAR